MTKDLLDEVVEERTRANPEFPVMVEAGATRARALIKELARRRGERGLSQTVVAARIGDLAVRPGPLSKVVERSAAHLDRRALRPRHR